VGRDLSLGLQNVAEPNSERAKSVRLKSIDSSVEM
jgi:hypothetical protein